jgi:hypothetical protein
MAAVSLLLVWLTGVISFVGLPPNVVRELACWQDRIFSTFAAVLR